jgi:hypothetical protein
MPVFQYSSIYRCARLTNGMDGLVKLRHDGSLGWVGSICNMGRNDFAFRHGSSAILTPANRKLISNLTW